MFNNGLFALNPYRYAMDDFPLLGRRPTDLMDRWMDILEPWSTGALVNEPSLLSRPRDHVCPFSSLLERPRHAPLQHFIVVPNLLREPSRTDEKQDGGQQKDKKEEAAEGSSEQQQQSASATNTSEGASAGGSQAPWHFSVDMSGCDEVRAMTEKGMLMVEGRGSSDTSQQMVRYITSLPRHITHDSLAASLNDGRLTITQKGGQQQLQDQPRTLPIQVEQQQQQQQQGTEQQQKQPVAEAKKEEQPMEP